MRGGAALPVQGFAGRIADRVDRALLAEHLQVPVDRGEPDGLAARRSSAWISWALQKPGRLASAAARADACRVPRTFVPRG